jgi:CRP-like cAMP-binding protein
MTPIKTWMLSKEHLLGIINKYPIISLQFLRVIARRVRSATQKSEAMAFQDVQGRLAYEMLSLASRSNTHTVDGTLIEVPLNQIELASMVGATRESVNKALSMFKSQNLIKLTGTSIVITNRDGLEKITLERGR